MARIETRIEAGELLLEALKRLTPDHPYAGEACHRIADALFLLSEEFPDAPGVKTETPMGARLYLPKQHGGD